MNISRYLRTVLLFCLALILLGNVTSHATSLYPSGQRSLFEDRKAKRTGDLVTVIIVEQAQARQTAGTSTGKDSEVSVGPGVGVLADLIPLLRLSGGDNFRADGSTARGGSLTAKITTRVVESFSNETMRIEGRQKILINGEEQEIIISGLVRNRDVAPDNTILSTFVADSEISFVGTGVVGSKNKPGLITRVFNWLF